jgi:DNA-binding MarR family transcriptional regulator
MASAGYRLDDSIGYLINRASRFIRRRMNAALAAAGHTITGEEWAVLVHLWHADGQPQQHLADTLHKDKTTMTRLINGLEKQNLVARVPDQADRRQKLIYLTAQGRALEGDVIPLAVGVLGEAQRGIPPAQVALCKDVLRMIYANLAEEGLDDSAT